MSSILKVNTLQDAGGNAILTSDGSGNLTTLKTNYPAFEVYLSANQSITDATHTKCEFDIERFDTNNCYDNTTNYRFTPNVAGKYYVYCQIELDSITDGQVAQSQARIYKNGTAYQANIEETTGNATGRFVARSVVATIDMNGTTDYLEGYGFCDDTSGNPQFQGASTPMRTFFGAYRIGD